MGVEVSVWWRCFMEGERVCIVRYMPPPVFVWCAWVEK